MADASGNGKLAGKRKLLAYLATLVVIGILAFAGRLDQGKEVADAIIWTFAIFGGANVGEWMGKRTKTPEG